MTIASLEKGDIKKIFLGSKNTWDGEQVINFVVMKDNTVHEEFVKKYTQKTESQFKRYWRKQVFTGKGISPKSFRTEAEVVQYVANTDGAIGYISSNTSADGVNRLVKISMRRPRLSVTSSRRYWVSVRLSPCPKCTRCSLWIV